MKPVLRSSSHPLEVRMNLSLRKAGTLLVAGLAFAACSTDSNDSPLSPPLGMATVDDGFISIKVCKVIVDPAATGSKLANEDVEGFGEEVFFETSEGDFSLFAGNGTGPNPTLDCTDDFVSRPWKTGEILVPVGSDFSVTEVATTASGGTVAISSVSLIPFNDVGGCVDLVDMTATLTDVGNNPCTAEAGEPYKLVFKNIFEQGDDETGFEGCTPGGWRNNYDGSASPNDWWENNPLDPSDSFASTFGVLPEELEQLGFDANLTLLQALNQDSNRGGLSLVKHATAALLNSLDPDVDYFYTETEVRDMFDDAFEALLAGDRDTSNDIKDMFDEANNLGCPQ
jgi:hypothetical protein